jgi:hypothetical protein
MHALHPFVMTDPFSAEVRRGPVIRVICNCRWASVKFLLLKLKQLLLHRSFFTMPSPDYNFEDIIVTLEGTVAIVQINRGRQSVLRWNNLYTLTSYVQF